ncbi:acyl carrier protein [Caulobacter soli]|uniref:acyl carrier protein n=1 Tax=Caulobacter soli TaxID=2708539 RepID=UPI0013EAFA39|nr:acyl carrier protein [Caulobacter soli]
MSHLHEQVIALLAEERGLSVSEIDLNSRLLEDLGMDGDDAVEFFDLYEKRFAVDLKPLWGHWRKHFGPEGLGWSDYRFNLAAFACICCMAAGLYWTTLPPWVTPVAGLALITTFGLGWRSERKNKPHVSLTAAHLIEAAVTKRWPLDYSVG